MAPCLCYYSHRNYETEVLTEEEVACLGIYSRPVRGCAEIAGGPQRVLLLGSLLRSFDKLLSIAETFYFVLVEARRIVVSFGIAIVAD
jgi:hypothetical protein